MRFWRRWSPSNRRGWTRSSVPELRRQQARADLGGQLADGDLETIARGADVDGNPVSGLVALLRQRTEQPTAHWLHRGLTSQDVVDTALMLCVRDATRPHPRGTCRSGADAVATRRNAPATPMLARTLTQAALPSTAGVKVARWLSAVLDAAEPLAELRMPVQAGGAAGTLAAAVELSGSVEGAISLATRWRSRSGSNRRHPGTQRVPRSLESATPWPPVATRGAISPPTSPPAVGLRSVSWPNRAGAGHRPCRRRTIRCARC